jgi:Zn-dependent peptidase ImmA (M78 family)
VTTPAERAIEERARLGLSSRAATPDLLGLIENVAKVRVIAQQLGAAGIAGAYALRRGIPFIFINASMATARARFTLAHEYGHHVLQHGLSVDKVIDLAGSQPAKEVEANSFAAEFLLPLEALDGWLRERDYPDMNLNLVVEVARDFWVSAIVASYRLSSAHRIDQRTLAAVVRAIEQRDHLRVRPSEGMMLPESLAETKGRERRLPGDAEYALLRAFERGLLSEGDLKEKLRLQSHELQELLRRLSLKQADEI